MYSLPQDTAPLPTPVLAQAQGVHIRSLTWIGACLRRTRLACFCFCLFFFFTFHRYLAWSIRATGFAYYDSVIWWGPGPKGEPRIRAKLFREAMEDYEIMVLANGNLKPRANTEEVCFAWNELPLSFAHLFPTFVQALDPTVRSISTSLNSWSKDPSAYHILKVRVVRVAAPFSHHVASARSGSFCWRRAGHAPGPRCSIQSAARRV